MRNHRSKQSVPSAATADRHLWRRAVLGGGTLALAAAVIGAAAAEPVAWRISSEFAQSMKRWAGLGMIVVVVVSLYSIYLMKFHRDVLSRPGWLRVVLLQILYLLCVQLVLQNGLSVYAIPMPLFALLLSLLTGRRQFALAALCVLTVLCRIVSGVDQGALLVLFFGSVVVVFSSVPIGSRWRLMGTGVSVAFVYCCVLVGLWLAGFIGTTEFPDHVMWSSVMGFAYVGILANAGLPLIEYLFDVTTHMTLLEISSQSHPLLRRLVLEAPGTYHHSLIVGNLAEAAAEAAGCDWLLARVGSYYHDIGKLEKPLYFTENTTNMPDRHEKLSAAMSSLIITAHPKDGVQIARSYRLPQDIVDFVEQHHGKSVVEYFYQQALVRAGDENKPSPETFRYTTPKPKKKEVGIVLLADAVEATTRNLSDPTPTRIKSLVRDVIAKRLVDGQLDECPLTLNDLKKVRESFERVLIGMYHSRIRYPETEQDKDSNGNRDNGQADRRQG